MNDEALEDIAESDAEARWIVDHHTSDSDSPSKRGRCNSCGAWWPCDLVSLAALAVLRQRQRERLYEELALAKQQSTLRGGGESV